VFPASAYRVSDHHWTNPAGRPRRAERRRHRPRSAV